MRSKSNSSNRLSKQGLWQPATGLALGFDYCSCTGRTPFPVAIPLSILAWSPFPFHSVFSTKRKSIAGVRVLVAEDSPDNQLLISHLLTKEGAVVDIVDIAVGSGW